MITLYQFQFSHYCEKVRWALDYKSIPFTRENLLPGSHREVSENLAPKSCLPIIVDDGTVVQDSTDIITFLDNKYPRQPLTPQSARQRTEALEWEEYLDDELGVTLRVWFYYHIFPDEERALRFLLEGVSHNAHAGFIARFPDIRARMLQFMNIHAASAQKAEERITAALARLERALTHRAFLVPDGFSRADLTACALLSPAWLPGKSDEEVGAALPEPVVRFRDEHKASRTFEWVSETYRTYRHALQ